MKKRYALALLMLLFTFKTQAEEYDFGFESRVFYSEIETKENVSLSNIWLEYNSEMGGDALLEDMVNFDNFNGHKTTNWTVRVSLSSLPSFLEGQAKEEILESAQPAIREMALKMFAANPAFSTIPSEYKDSVVAEIESQILVQTTEMIDSRVAKVRTELSLQEFYVGRETCQRNHYVDCSFVKIGKAKVGLSADSDNPISVQPNLAEKAQSTVGTSFVSFGVRNSEETVELIVFNSRKSFVDGRSYLASVVNLSEEDYEEHNDLVDLDSLMLKRNAKYKGYSLGISVAQMDLFKGGSYFETSAQLQTLLDEDTSIEYSLIFASDAKRAGVEKAISMGLKRALTNRLNANVYIAYFGAADDPFTSSRERLNYTRKELNLEWRLLDGDHCSLLIKAGFEDYSGDIEDFGTVAAANAKCYMRKRN